MKKYDHTLGGKVECCGMLRSRLLTSRTTPCAPPFLQDGAVENANNLFCHETLQNAQKRKNFGRVPSLGGRTRGWQRPRLPQDFLTYAYICFPTMILKVSGGGEGKNAQKRKNFGGIPSTRGALDIENDLFCYVTSSRWLIYASL